MAVTIRFILVWHVHYFFKSEISAGDSMVSWTRYIFDKKHCCYSIQILDHVTIDRTLSWNEEFSLFQSVIVDENNYPWHKYHWSLDKIYKIILNIQSSKSNCRTTFILGFVREKNHGLSVSEME